MKKLLIILGLVIILLTPGAYDYLSEYNKDKYFYKEALASNNFSYVRSLLRDSIQSHFKDQVEDRLKVISENEVKRQKNSVQDGCFKRSILELIEKSLNSGNKIRVLLQLSVHQQTVKREKIVDSILSQINTNYLIRSLKTVIPTEFYYYTYFEPSSGDSTDLILNCDIDFRSDEWEYRSLFTSRKKVHGFDIKWIIQTRKCNTKYSYKTEMSNLRNEQLHNANATEEKIYHDIIYNQYEKFKHQLRIRLFPL